MATSSAPHKDAAHPPPSPPSALETQKIIKLEAHIAAVEAQIASIKAQEEEIQGKLKSPNPPSVTVTTHIRLLHAYNETRDMATGLMGIIAENRGVRARDVYEEFGVEEGG